MTLSGYDIRLANSIVNPVTFMNTDSYLVRNWTRTSDMPASIDWSAEQPDFGAMRRFSPSLALGTGKRLGAYQTKLSFFTPTYGMRNYLEQTFLNGNGTSVITCYIHDPTDPNVFSMFTGEMVSPYHLESEYSYVRVTDEQDLNVVYGLQRLTKVNIDVLAMSATTVLSDHNGNIIYVG